MRCTALAEREIEVNRERPQGIDLPDLVSLRHYGTDIVITGPVLTQALYDEICAKLPVEIRTRILGWRRTGR